MENFENVFTKDEITYITAILENEKADIERMLEYLNNFQDLNGDMNFLLTNRLVWILENMKLNEWKDSEEETYFNDITLRVLAKLKGTNN